MPGLVDAAEMAAARAALAAILANFFSRFVGTGGRFICCSLVEEVDESDSKPSRSSYH